MAVACSKNDSNSENEPIDTGNNAPVISSQTFTIAEHSAAGTSIGIVEATDIDGDELVYSISSEWDLVVDQNSGELTVGPTLKLDYESNQTVTFTISVSDGKDGAEKDFSLVIEDVDENTLLTDDHKELITYFEYLALWKGPNNTRVTAIQKWEDPMKMRISGTVSGEFKTAIESAIGQFNSYMTLSEFNISTTEDADVANAHVFIGAKEELKTVWPDMYGIIKNGTYYGYAMTANEGGKSTSSRIWIHAEDELLFKHEMGHALGLGHSDRCGQNGSFLCSSLKGDMGVMPIEQEIIKYLYSSDLPAGLLEADINDTLANIILNDQ